MENYLEARDAEGVNDAILLGDTTSTEVFIENLRKRFQANIIYTYIGPVLISVNPYKNLPIYGPEHVKKYQNVNFIEVAPHIFGLTDNAYRQLKEETQDQCILISGESGSGKTEASKKILEYIAAASKHLPTIENTKDKLLESNPVLEAFGNARTTRNDNSSRFGKYMDIEFDFRGSPVGGNILNYLLEKSRVVVQAEGERNFHIFYQLISGADDALLDQLQLTRDPMDYHYLRQGKVADVTAEDAKQFQAVEKAMRILGFSEEEKLQVLQIVGAVIHLGNVAFAPDGSHGKVDTPEVVKKAGELLGCKFDELSKALTFRTIDARGDFVTSPLSKEQCYYARDAISKAVYSRLFTWLVKKLNESLQSHYEGQKTLMGILDIYGFEIFESNSFEQFCINYCNEKLQQLFIELTLKSEQEEYRREGIEWEHVEYFNNKIICDLIEEKHKGIISILDEECLRPGNVSDVSFLGKMDKALASHAHYMSHKGATTAIRKSLGREEFRIQHYAGVVTYKVNGFLDKNNDLLFRDLKELMSQANNSILQAIFPEEELTGKKRPDTAATQFKTSLNQLMEILMSKEPSYVRCIKPNDYKTSGLFDLENVDHQVKYLGLMENLRVRRAGFAYRRRYDVFLQRYKSLCPQTWPHYKGDDKEGVDILMKHLGYNEDHYRMGKTKIFIRHAITLFAIEDRFQEKKRELVSKIKALWKGRKQRKEYLKFRYAVIMCQKYARGLLAKRALKKRKWASSVIRDFVKGFINRNGEVSEANAKFLQFVRYKFLMRLSQQLPNMILRHDRSWPEAPPCALEASRLLCKVHRRHEVRKYIKNLQPEKKAQLHLKLLAHELFKGKKCSYEATVKNKFIDYRLQEDKRVMLLNNNKTAGEKFLYATSVTKYDRHGYKDRARTLAVSDTSIVLFNDKDMKPKLRLPLNALPGLTVTNMGDGLLIVRIPLEQKKLKGDLIVSCENVVETVTKIINICNGNKNLLKIEPPGEVKHQMNGGKQGVIEVKKTDAGTAYVRSKGHLIVNTSC